MSSVKRPIEIVFFAVFSAALVGLLFGGNLRADFWLIDDHEIVNFISLAPGGFLDFFTLFQFSEISNFGNSVRYRPGFYTLYILESLLWGANAFLWYLCRLFMASVFAFACIYIVARIYNWLSGILFVVLVFSYPYWTDVLSRLGPAEIYCAFGLAIFAISMERLLALDRPGPLWSVLLAVGVFIAAGAKENFLLLLLPLAMLAYLLHKRKKLAVHAAVSMGFSAIYIGVIVVELLIAISKTKADMHLDPITFAARLAALAGALKSGDFLFALAVLLASCIVYLFLRGRGEKFQDLRSGLARLVLVGLGAVCLLLTQVVFYNGEWPRQMRYDFPGMMVTPLLVVVLCNAGSDVLQRRWKWIGPVVVMALVLLVFTPHIRSGMNALREGTEANVARTLDTKMKIVMIASALKADATIPLVIESHQAYFVEPIVSLKRFLRHHGVANPLLVRVHGYTPETQTSELYRRIATAITSWAKADEAEVAKAANRCYSVHVGGEAKTDCRTLTVLMN